MPHRKLGINSLNRTSITNVGILNPSGRKYAIRCETPADFSMKFDLYQRLVCEIVQENILLVDFC